MALFEIREGVCDPREREDPVGHRPQLALVDQSGQQVEVHSAGVHEQEPVADSLLAGPATDLGTGQPQRGCDERAGAEALATAGWSLVHGLAFLHLDGKLPAANADEVEARVTSAITAILTLRLTG